MKSIYIVYIPEADDWGGHDARTIGYCNTMELAQKLAKGKGSFGDVAQIQKIKVFTSVKDFENAETNS